jgi:hypothetical protein
VIDLAEQPAQRRAHLVVAICAKQEYALLAQPLREHREESRLVASADCRSSISRTSG